MPDYLFIDKRKYVLTEHASLVISEREIPIEWISRTISQPDKIEPDRDDPNVLHALSRIDEYG